MGLAIAVAVAYFVVSLIAVISLGKTASEADKHAEELYDQGREVA